MGDDCIQRTGIRPVLAIAILLVAIYAALLVLACSGCRGAAVSGVAPTHPKSLAAAQLRSLTVSLQYPFALPGWSDTGLAVAWNASTAPVGFFRSAATPTTVSIVHASAPGGPWDTLSSWPYQNADMQPFNLTIKGPP